MVSWPRWPMSFITSNQGFISAIISGSSVEANSSSAAVTMAVNSCVMASTAAAS